MRNYRRIAVIAVSILSVVVACGEPIPIKEMVSARKAITKAVEVQADKYAPQELESARNELLAAHDKIKADDLSKAKASAEESYKFGVAAYDKAIPLLAKDTIAAAEQSIAEAVVANAEMWAKDELDDATATLGTAKELNTKTEFYNAYQKAVEADNKAKDAKDIAIGKKEILSDAIAEIKATLQKITDMKGESFGEEQIKLAQENLTVSEEALGELKLKDGYAAMEVAKMNADAAYLKAMEGTAQKEYTAASEVVAKAEASEGAAVAADELAAAKESLANAKSNLENAQYQESIDYSREASRLAKIVAVTKKPAGAVAGNVSAGTETAEVETNDNGEMEYLLYTVVYRKTKRDCLWRIADRFYKDPLKWKLIYKANRDRIRNPHLIYPGWVLKVPKLKN